MDFAINVINNDFIIKSEKGLEKWFLQKINYREKRGRFKMKLFIIGNGFDLSHDLPTSYYDFLEYLVENNKNSLVDALEQITGFQRAILWSNFEENLGEIRPDFYIDIATQQRNDMYSSLECSYDAEETINLHVDNEVINGLGNLEELTSEWIRSINVNEHIKKNAIRNEKKYNEVINNGSFYITFNYTEVLQIAYGIYPENVYHIHGDVEEPFMGHDTILDDNVLHEDEINDQSAMFEHRIYDEIKDFVNSLNKDIYRRIKILNDILNPLDVSEINVIGLSFGRIDTPYFKLIHKKFGNASWNFSYFGETDTDEKRDIDRRTIYLESIGINKAKIKPISFF